MPALTVRTAGSQRTFAPGHDVVIGRDLQADVRVANPLVSRAHIVLRFDRGRWLAIDNGSLNGMFVDRRRVSSVDISDGQSINISNPDGPRLTFEVGRRMGAVGRPPSGPKPVRPPSGPQPVPRLQRGAVAPTGRSWRRASSGSGPPLRRHRGRPPPLSAAPPTTTS